MRAAARLLARVGLRVLLVGSLLLMARGVIDLRVNPALSPFVERGADEFRAAVDAATARAATEAHVSTLLAGYLAQNPRDWIALRAVEDVAAERGLALHPTLVARIETAWEEDSGFLTKAGSCLKCSIDATSCSVSEALVCNVPVALTPVGDVTGLMQEGLNAAKGKPVDKLNLTLSALGLGATVAIVATEGTSIAVKAGASGLKMARKMRLLNPKMEGWLMRAGSDAVDMNALKQLRWPPDVSRVFRRAPLQEIAGVGTDLWRVAQATDARTALRLLPHVDDAADARRLARMSEALGPKTLGRIEVLGKARLFRLGLRLSDVARDLFAGLAGLAAASVGFAQSAGLRLARRGLRRIA